MPWIWSAVLVALLFFFRGLYEEFETPKIGIVRALAAGALVAAVVASLGRGATRGRGGRGAKPEGAEAARRWMPLDLAVLGWLAVEIAATVAASSPRLALFGSVQQREGLITSAALAALYAAARLSLRRPADLVTAFVVAIGAGTLAALYALLQAVGIDPIEWGRGQAAGVRRPFGTLGDPARLATVCAALAAGAIALAVRERKRRPLFVGAAVVLGLAAAMGVARAGWLPLDANREVWRSAIAAWRDRPWLGQGPDHFEVIFPRYQTAAYWRHAWGDQPLDAHSIYLHALATRGVLGAVAGAAWIVAALAAAGVGWRRSAVSAEGAGARETRAALAVTLATGAVLLAGGALGAIGIGGALLLVVGSAGVASLASPRAARAVPGGRRLLASALGVGVAIAALIPAFTDWDASRAGRLAEGLPPPTSAEAARMANRLAPWEDLYARLRSKTALAAASQVQMPDELLREAQRAGMAAVAIQPLRAANHRALAHVLVVRMITGEAKRAKDAAEMFRKTLELAPVDPVTLTEYAQSELAMNRPTEAIAPARRAAELYPGESSVLTTLAAAQMAVLDTAGSIATLRRALAADWHGNTAARDQTERLLQGLVAAASRPPAPAPPALSPSPGSRAAGR